ncbi:hypothetical protein ACF09H_40620 [Streptomyces sp. NPDC014983]|uniref:hypothetical protein n=1 Tax=Streptomyces sp. NPDC014983 TaxID=3364933 RepID=UPI0036FCAE17
MSTVLVCGGVPVVLRHLSVSGAGEVAWLLTLTGSAHPLLPGAAKSHVILTLTTSLRDTWENIISDIDSDWRSYIYVSHVGLIGA